MTLSGGGTKESSCGPPGGDGRLSTLREEMATAGVDALVIPSGDPHLSEYVHPTYERRAFISSFTGSAGTALVTPDAALLWTDGRYFLQATQELSSDWTLMRSLQPNVPSLEEWLAANLPDKAVLGIDPNVHSVDEAKKLEDALRLANRGMSLKPLSVNPVDSVWANPPAGCSARPAPPGGKARALPLEVSGQSCEAKLASLAENVRAAGATAYLAGALDEVCWLFNLRGSDVPCCPVVQAYALVRVPSEQEAEEESGVGQTDSGGVPTATLYLDETKLEGVPGLRETLRAAGVTSAPYDQIQADVKGLAASGEKLMLDSDKVNYALRLAAGAAAVTKPSPVTMPKACKNEAELSGMREAHREDGAALAQFFAWLTRMITSEGTSLTECEITAKLEGFRAGRRGFLDLSFPTICGVGKNGAIIHYNCNGSPATIAACATLEAVGAGGSGAPEMLLLDSGGQYATGTTDVTRTIHLGSPSLWQRECFTRVLKGNIALSTATFPEGTPGPALDAFARSALWSAGLDYLHGTGHGVGAALNVHEGPQSISTRYANTVGLKAGMICSNEPGYYEDGAFGIRIEHLLVVHQKDTPNAFNGKTFLGFDPLTMVPVQASLLEPALMTHAEVEWLDTYHQRVWEEISPRLSEDDEGYTWLAAATRPLSEQLRDLGIDLGVPPTRGDLAMAAQPAQ